MASIPSSLNKYVSWFEAAPLLGLKPQRYFPQNSKCPCCSEERLTTYKDNKIGGEWHYCWSCKFKGDTIELLSRVWKLSIRATVFKLAKNGINFPTDKITPEYVTSYEKNHIKRRKHFRKFWKDCRALLADCPTQEIRKIQNKLGIRVDLTPERWAKGPGLLVGGCHNKTAEIAFHPNAAFQGGYAGSENKMPQNPSKARIFRGRKWGDVLVVASYDMPGRVSGFWFVGRGADDEDITFKRVDWGPPYHGKPRHGNGIGMASAVWNASQEWGNVVFVVDSPIIALRMQAVHFVAAQRPLPVVCWFDHNNQVCEHDWAMLQQKNIIFWTPKPNSSLMRQAIWSGGKISTAGPEEYSEFNLDRYMSRVRPDELLSRIQNKAKPWGDALAEQIPDMTNNDIENLFLELEFQGLDIENILDQLDPTAYRRVTNIVNYKREGRTIAINNQEVVEQEDGWYSRKKGKQNQLELMSDAVIRVDTVVSCEQSLVYEGRVLYQKEEIPFCENKEVVEKDTAKWLEEFLIRQEKGVLVYIPSWSKHLLTIAKQFQTPKLRKGVNMLGWNTDLEAFVLPDGVVRRDGKMEAKAYHVADKDWLHGIIRRIPITIAPPKKDTVELVSGTPKSGIMWSVIIATAYNLVAGLLNKPRRDVALTSSKVTEYAERYAEQLGLPVRSFTAANVKRNNVWGRDDLLSLLYLDKGVTPKNITQWLNRSAEFRGVLVELDWLQERTALANGWLTIRAAGKVRQTIQPNTQHMLGASCLLPGYLAWVLENIDTWDTETKSLLDCVKVSFARYLDSVGGNGAEILQKTHAVLLHNTEHRLDAVGQLLGMCVDEGTLELCLDSDKKTRTNRIMRDFSSEGALISPVGFRQAIKMKDGPELDTDAVQSILEASGKFQGYETRNNAKGWIIDSDWLYKSISDYRNPKAALRIVG